ncbi:DUF4241 domain-containing protein [Actinoallomurus vinaceus]|uniref:DUF4241 domain-containing protein n=1 Tax=Actinoallomurus vinaceus TaxID=1080074 RepID=A0ABP8UG80_9ACTN
MPVAPPDLSAYFTDGRSYRDTGTTIVGDPYDFLQKITVEYLGELSMPSGRVLVCDPMLVGSDLPALAEHIEPGRHPVSVARLTTAMADHPEGTWSEIAAMRIVVRDTPAVAWEPALLEGQEDPEVLYGYPVDTGLACFVDMGANTAFAQQDDPWENLTEVSRGWDVVPAVVTDPATGHAIAVTHSGAGDGLYPTWIGRDADDEVTCVVTTFMHDIK